MTLIGRRRLDRKGDEDAFTFAPQGIVHPKDAAISAMKAA
jgi:hypothetical protein